MRKSKLLAQFQSPDVTRGMAGLEWPFCVCALTLQMGIGVVLDLWDVTQPSQGSIVYHGGWNL